MHSPYRGRSHTKKQKTNKCKQAITAVERELRDEKKRLTKLFSKLKFRIKTTHTSEINVLVETPRFKNGTFKSIYQHFKAPLSARRGAGGEARNT